jgi:Tfp pilus assembly protein PilO
MDKILKKHILSLVFSILVTILFSGVVFFFYNSFNKKITKVSEIKERIASYQKNKKAFSEEADKLRVLENRLNTVEKAVVTSESVPNLLSKLETLAQGSSVSFEITTVQTPVKEGAPKLFVEISTKGSYENIQFFLNQLQHQDFQIKISSLYFLAEQTEQSSAAISGVLPVSTNKVVVAPVIIKEKQWQGVASIEILSF